MNETGLSVSELSLIISEAIRRDPRTRSVLVRGEVSGFRNQIASGHWYFSLKDPDAAVSCIMYRTNTLKAKLRPKDGDLVLLHDMTGNVETVKALRTVIPTLLDRGFRFTTCGNLFKEKGVTPVRGRLYSNVLQTVDRP